MIKLPMEQAKKLYINAGGPDDNDEEKWEDIRKELEVIINSKSDYAAGRTIDWWGCWDNKYTATKFARTIRNQYAAMRPDLADIFK